VCGVQYAVCGVQHLNSCSVLQFAAERIAVSGSAVVCAAVCVCGCSVVLAAVCGCQQCSSVRLSGSVHIFK
jgi:hypothetical protein